MSKTTFFFSLISAAVIPQLVSTGIWLNAMKESDTVLAKQILSTQLQLNQTKSDLGKLKEACDADSKLFDQLVRQCTGVSTEELRARHEQE